MVYAFKGDSIVLTNIGSLVSVEIEARAVLLGPKGKPDEVSTGIIDAQSDRTTSDAQSSQRFNHDGEIVSAHVRVVSGSPVRGQLFAVLRVRNGPELCRGYLTTGQGVNLGTFENSLGGRGHVAWRTIADDTAPADTIAALATTNTLRRVYGFVWYYHCSSDAGTRGFSVGYNNPGLATPTGYSQTGLITQFIQTALGLTPNQEGVMYASSFAGQDGFGVTNDNDAALVIQPSSSAPDPLPFLIEENDLAEIRFNVANENANDRMSIYISQEEWLLA